MDTGFGYLLVIICNRRYLNRFKKLIITCNNKYMHILNVNILFYLSNILHSIIFYISHVNEIKKKQTMYLLSPSYKCKI